MAWTAYRLVYKALSPVHVGHHKLGFIQRTRYYITGRNVWGAMTANLARSQSPAAMQNYKTFGEKVMNSAIMTTYFYPSVGSGAPLLPSYRQGALKYGDMEADEFERLFISSFGQTAITPSKNTAEDESLHETEFISHFDRDGKPVYFVGYIFIKNDTTQDWNSINPAINEIFVGGERKYGFGRLRLEGEGVKKVEDNKIFNLGCDLTGAHVVLNLKQNDAIPAHLKVGASAGLKGDIEPLVGREWGEIMDRKGKMACGAGQKVSSSEVCWVPGSVAQMEIDLKIGPYGILDRHNGDNGQPRP